MKYQVKFRRPDGTEAWLGESGRGSADKKESPRMALPEAQQAAEDRNRVYGPWFNYWVEQAEED